MPLAFYQPKFLVQQVVEACNYEGRPAELEPELIGEALQHLSPRSEDLGMQRVQVRLGQQGRGRRIYADRSVLIGRTANPAERRGPFLGPRRSILRACVRIADVIAKAFGGSSAGEPMRPKGRPAEGRQERIVACPMA